MARRSKPQDESSGPAKKATKKAAPKEEKQEQAQEQPQAPAFEIDLTGLGEDERMVDRVTQALQGVDLEAEGVDRPEIWRIIANEVVEQDEEARKSGLLTPDGAEAVKHATRTLLRGAQRNSVPQGWQRDVMVQAQGDHDTGRMLGAAAVVSAAAQAGAAPAVQKVDFAELLRTRVAAGMALAASTIEAMKDEVGEAHEGLKALQQALDALGEFEEAKEIVNDKSFDEIWKDAYGGRVPDPTKVPGRRSSGGGGGSSVGRSLKNIPDGPVQYTHKGETFTATIKDGTLTIDADGKEFSAPSGAARHVNGGTQVNGWNVWTRDGKSLADLHEEADE